LTVRVDFGRVVPGIVLIVGALVSIAILGVVATVSYLFSFISFWNGVLQVSLMLMPIPALILALGVVVTVTGVSWWGGWWGSSWASVRAAQDRLRISQRVGELIGVGVTLIVFSFLYGNQLRGAAFFTSQFGFEAQFLFYAPLFTGIVLSLGRAFYGRKNAVRPLDSVNALFLAFAAFWLLSLFPFDFTQFGSLFPAGVQGAFFWLNNDIGRALFLIAGVCSVINFLYTAVLYVAVRSELIAAKRPD